MAAEFLERQGLTVVARNYRTRRGEVDIIAVRRMGGRQGRGRPCTGEPEGTVHFVEVKTRTGLEYGTPGAAVTYIKQRRIRTTALHWLREERACYPRLSFDVVEIWVRGETAGIRWLPHCF